MSRGSADSVCVVVPFAGDLAAAVTTINSLRTLVEVVEWIVIADNSDDQVVATAIEAAGLMGRIEPVSATLERSAYHARNAAGRSASGEWMLFLDADCTLGPDLIEGFFATPIPAAVGVVAGSVVHAPNRASLSARRAEARFAGQDEFLLGAAAMPAGSGQNLLIRSAAWRAVGGYCEGLRSGGDVEICWRIQEIGWAFEFRFAARVVARSYETLAGMRLQARRYGAGRRWLRQRSGETMARPALFRPIWRAPAAAAWHLLHGRREAAAFKLLDLIAAVELARGYWCDDNRAPRIAALGRGPVAIEATQPSPAAVAAAVGSPPWVEAEARPLMQRLDSLGRPSSVTFWAEDEAPLTRLISLVALLVRHPLRCLRDRSIRRSEGGELLRRLAPAARRVAGWADSLAPASPDDPAASIRARRLSALAGLAPAPQIPPG